MSTGIVRMDASITTHVALRDFGSTSRRAGASSASGQFLEVTGCSRPMATRLGLCLARGISHAIVLVLDGQGGASSQPNLADRLIPGRKPEGLDLLVFVMNFALLRPERRVLGRFTFNAGDGEIGSVHPYLATIDVVTPGLRADPQHILPTRL